MKQLLPILKPYRWMAVAAAVLVFVQALAEISLPTLMASIVDIGVVQGDTGHILKVGGVMVIVAASGMIAAFFGARLASLVAVGFARDLRNRLFAHISSFSLQEFDKVGTATLITRTTNDVSQVQQLAFMSLRMMIRAPLMAIGGMIMALMQDVRLSLILFACIPLLAAVIYAISSKGMPLFKAVQEKIDRLNLVTREALSGVRVIRAFNRTDYEEKRFDDANRELTGTSIKVSRLMAAMEPSTSLIFNFTIIAILWFGGVRIDQGELQVGRMMAFIQYAMQIMFSLMMVSMILVMVPRAAVSASRIGEVLALQPEITDPDEPVTPAEENGIVEFDDVTFYYPGAEVPALQNVSFTARPGEVTAIIGGIGSGKTTLAALLLRFYDVTQGSIRVDGVDIRQMSQKELRQRFAYVPQRAMLFTGTIAENLRYGKPDATDGEVRHAAESAQAAEFIERLDEGYDALIAQGGTNFSGGQRQRLTIARALVRRPKIYIFDDNFSALDFKTDAKVRMALQRETKDATVIIVAQRVSTIMDADQIIVLDQGKVVGIGTHRELLASCQIYREIVASQLAEEVIA
jgi:ABC-type multidrug transport system, ATPase and permease components